MASQVAHTRHIATNARPAHIERLATNASTVPTGQPTFEELQVASTGPTGPNAAQLVQTETTERPARLVLLDRLVQIAQSTSALQALQAQLLHRQVLQDPLAQIAPLPDRQAPPDLQERLSRRCGWK